MLEADGCEGADRRKTERPVQCDRRRLCRIADHRDHLTKTACLGLRNQLREQAAADALVELDAASGPLATAEKLAEQGFGPRMKSTADDVLARLNAKRTQAA